MRANPMLAIITTFGLLQAPVLIQSSPSIELMRARDAMAALVQLGVRGVGAAPTLRRLLDHSDPGIASAAQQLLDLIAEPAQATSRSNATRTLAEPATPEPPRLDDLLERLGTIQGDRRAWFERARIFEDLGRVGLARPDLCIPILVRGLEDRPGPASSAAAGLVAFGPECCEIVLQSFRRQLDRGWALYDLAKAYGILARMGTPEAFQMLLECEGKRSRGGPNQKRFLIALVDALRTFAAVREPAVRRLAIESLARILRGETWSHPSSWTVERVAARALASLVRTNRLAENELERALFDGYEDSDHLVLRALYGLGSDAVNFEGALLAIIEEHRGDRRGRDVLALGVLGSIGPPAAGALPRILELIDDGATGAAALWAASRIAPDDPHVVELVLDRDDSDLRRLCQLIHSWVPHDAVNPVPQPTLELGPEAIPALLAGLRTHTWEVRKVWQFECTLRPVPPVASFSFSVSPWRYVTWLKRFPEATPGLLRLVVDPDPFVRTQAALALGRMDPPHSAALKPLLDLLGHPPLGWNAARAIASYGESVVPALVKVLEALPVD